MRKLVAIVLAIVVAKAGVAQNSETSARIFKPFKVDISVGYASPQNTAQGANFSGGGLFAIEPKYAVIDPLAIGVRLEAAVTAHLYNNSSGSNNSNGKANVSYIFTTDYYFTHSKFRPFIGAGAGVYITANLDSNTVNGNTESIPSTSQFGWMVRAGFELGHLRIGAEYNIVANNASYLGLKLGICIGGGRRRR